MKILITGGSGLVGSHLTQLMKGNGHEVRHLSRKKHNHPQAEVFEWNPNEMIVENGALDGVEVVVNLAGAGVAEKRWTADRKKALIESRIKSLQCLHEHVSKMKDPPKTLISASGIGYYGDQAFDKVSVETDDPGETFLAEICKAWEKEALEFESLGMRVSLLRIGIVLDREQGALPKMAQPINWFAGAALGSGEQIMPWIHILDICRLIQFVVDNEVKGPINAVGLDPKSNANFSKSLARILRKPFFLPPVPGFILKLMLGEMAEMVLIGNTVSNEKIQEAGFEFEFKNLDDALQEIYKVN